MCSPIDWENVGLADPSQELGLVLFEFGCGEAARARALYDAYLEAGGPGRIDRPGNFSMVIAKIAHIGEISCARWLDPARAREQQRNEGRIDEVVTQGITRRMVRRDGRRCLTLRSRANLVTVDAAIRRDARRTHRRRY